VWEENEMKIARVAVLAVLSLSTMLGVPRAGTGYLHLQCFGAIETDTDVASERTGEDTSRSPVMHVNPFVETENGEAFQCWVSLPDDYDSEGDPPTITFWGYVPPGQVCGISGACSFPSAVSWTISTRVYASASGIDMDWEDFTGSETTNTEYANGADASSCTGGNAWCSYPEEAMKFTGALAAEADDNNLSQGAFVAIHVARTADVLRYWSKLRVMVGAVTLA
jgi:hypothetical protein